MPVAPIALGATLLSSAVGAYGALSSGSAQAAAANYQAQIARQNAEQSRANAGIALAEGDQAQQQQYQLGAQRMGAARAAFGANNIEDNSGSALDTQLSIARTTGTNVADAGYNAEVQSVGYLNQASSDTVQAGLDRMMASNDQTAGLIDAGSSLLSGASQVSSKWLWMQSNGNLS